MSKGFINVKHYGNGNLHSYLFHKDITGYKHSMNLIEKKEILEHWEEIEKNEKIGNKAMGIRGRHDARVRTNYIMSMPNELSNLACIARVENIIKKSPILNCIYTINVYKKKEGEILNQYVILIVNPRYLDNNKKDREMQRKEWLLSFFVPLYQKEFEEEFGKGSDKIERERLHQLVFDIDRERVRDFIKEINL